MKNQQIRGRWIFSVSACLLMISLLAGPVYKAAGQDALEADDTEVKSEEVLAVRITCTEMIDDGLYESIKRRFNEAVDLGARYVVLDIQTYGGLVKAADDISKFLILGEGDKVHTVAYVTTEAISAGAMISVSCNDIIMKEDTTIGACAPVVMGGSLEGVEREKTESFIRAIFSRAAEKNGYPEALLKAMVSQKLEVYSVKNLETGKLEFFEKDYLPKDEKKYDLENKQVVVKDDEILTLTASKAKEYGIAREVVKDYEGLLKFLETRDNVKFSANRPVLETNWSEEMVRWLTSPVVSSALVMLIMLGVYMEFNTPGLGLPGLVAAISLVVLIGSKYMVGMANWIEIAVFIAGVLFLLAEIFVIPGFGLAGFTGIFLICAGIFGMLIKNSPGEIPWPDSVIEWTTVMDGLVSMAFGFVGFVVIAILIARYLPETRLFKGLVLNTDNRPKQVSVIEFGQRSDGHAKVTVGDRGIVVSPLRPIGQARFGNLITDVVAQGEFIKNDACVEVVEVNGNRVVVKTV